MELTTSRLLIRELTLDDAPHVLELLNSEGFINNVGDRGVRSLEQAIEQIETRYSADYPNYGLFAVVDKESGDWLGTVSHISRPFLEFDDIGYALLPEYFGKGYAYEATEALVNWAKQKGTPALLGLVDNHNTPSQRLLEKLNFEEVGTTLMEGETTPILKYLLEL